jgi:integrase
MMRRYASKHKTGVKNNYVPVVVDGMARIEDPSKRARKRTLTDREIRILFVACDRLGTFGNLCKVLLYTGQRRTLISTMRFDDVEEGLWEVPADDGAIGDQKGNIECVRLPKPVLEIIEAQAELQTNEFVFPASRVGRRDGPGENFGSFSAFGAGKAELDEAMAELSPDTPIPHWTLHDLRRTTGTLMPRLGIDDDHRERVLGHKLAGVKGVYNRYKYLDERSEALRKLATLIETIIRPPAKGGNVVSINRR